MSALFPRGVPLAVLAPALAFALAACSKQEPKTEDVRPVRAIVLASSQGTHQTELSGEVRARIESRLGFRVGGKISARKVDVGTPVKRGQVLMQLDPQDLRLSQSQSRAALKAAETARDLANSEYKRYQELRGQNYVSEAVLDSKRSAYQSAQAQVDAARAAYSGQSNQAAYSALVSDIDGVVTRVDAEVGQVVAPGTPVVTVAKDGGKEVVVGLPEDKVDALRAAQRVNVHLWAAPDKALPGKIREVSPVADPATRTYTAKVAIDGPKEALAAVKLGMSATVTFGSDAPAQLRVPLTALHHEKNVTSVWVVENGVVRLVPVQVGGVAGNDIVLAGGVKPGQQIVTAGVNLLKNGQKVTILTPENSPVPASRSLANAPGAKGGQ